MDRRTFLLLSATSSLAACAQRGVFAPAQPRPNTLEQPVFLVTDRVVEDGLNATAGRAAALTHARVNVLIPENHEVGNIEYPVPGRENLDAFGVASAVRYNREQDLLAEVARYGNPSDDVVVYVHGYNNTLAEAVYRHAQIANDFGLKGPQIAFSWASSAEPLGYAYDRDSITIARDKLEQLIIGLATRQHRRIILLAHSLGANLLTEVLRQMSIGGKSYLFSRFTMVALMSPDIDVEVFKSQVERIEPLPNPFIIFVSQVDYALRLSAGLRGKTERLGSTADIAELQGLGLTVIDLSSFDDGDTGDHFAAASSPTAIAMLRGIRQNGMPDERPERLRPGLAGIIFEATLR